jgi:hypothetical protein
MELTPDRSKATEAASAVDPVMPTPLSEASDIQVLNLAHKATQIIEAFPDRYPNPRELEEMTRVFGIDLVTVALVKILSQISPNRFFLERVDQAYRGLKAKDFVPQKTELGKLTPELCVIESHDPFSPGSAWGKHVEQWRAWARECGYTTEVIRTKPGNHPLENADLIRKQLLEMPHDNRVVATIGQGGAEFRILVEKLLKSAPHELHGVQMWLNVAGLVRGASGPQAPSRIDQKINGFGYRLHGWPSDIAGYLSSSHARLASEPDFSGLSFVCVSMVGLPNVLSAPAGLKGAFQRLGLNGPNDGVAMFHESIVRPGYIVPVSGMSHRAEPERLGPWLKSVLLAFQEDFILDSKNRRRLQIDL